MKVPTCKLCGKAHWSSEEHDIKESSVPGYVREMAKGAMGYEKRIPVFPDPDPPETVTTTTGGPLVYVPIKRTEPISGRNKRTDEPNKRTRGRPKKWASEAERKRAYRERSRG